MPTYPPNHPTPTHPEYAPVVWHTGHNWGCVVDIGARAGEVGINAVGVDVHPHPAGIQYWAAARPSDLKGHVDSADSISLNEPVLVLILRRRCCRQGYCLDNIGSCAWVGPTTSEAVASYVDACGHIIGALPDPGVEPVPNQEGGTNSN